MLNKSKYISYFRYFKEPPYALMTALHSLGIFSTSFAWNAFPTVLKEFPHMLSICWLLCLHSALRLIPNLLNLVTFGGLWRPGHLMQHSITLLLGQIALKQTGGLLDHIQNLSKVTRSVQSCHQGKGWLKMQKKPLNE